jgi:hypothetical protein
MGPRVRPSRCILDSDLTAADGRPSALSRLPGRRRRPLVCIHRIAILQCVSGPSGLPGRAHLPNTARVGMPRARLALWGSRASGGRLGLPLSATLSSFALAALIITLITTSHRIAMTGGLLVSVLPFLSLFSLALYVPREVCTIILSDSFLLPALRDSSINYFMLYLHISLSPLFTPHPSALFSLFLSFSFHL